LGELKIPGNSDKDRLGMTRKGSWDLFPNAGWFEKNQKLSVAGGGMDSYAG